MSKKHFKSQYLDNPNNLPEFIKNSPCYPELFHEEVEIVKNSKGKWGLRYESEEHVVCFDYDTFFEAYYDSDRQGDRSIWFSDEIAREIFGSDDDDEVRTVCENSNIGDTFFGKKCQQGYRMISRHHGNDAVEMLVGDYEEWLALDMIIDENSFVPENIAEVFNWLNTHPDFWTEQRMGTHYSWNTEGGIQSLWASPVRVDPETRESLCELDPDFKTKPFVTEWWIEGGPHVLNEDGENDYCTTHYHDTALDERGNTYDEALINFAKNVWLQSQLRLKEFEEE